MTVVAPQPVLATALPGPGCTGLQPGSLGSHPVTGSLTRGGMKQSVTVLAGKNWKAWHSSTTPESLLQVSTAFWSTLTSHPLTKSPWYPNPVGSPLDRTNGCLLSYHISLKSLTENMTS